MSSTSAGLTSPETRAWSAWHVDTAHSLVGFSVRHMMLSNVRGRFTGISGTVVDAGEDPKRSSVKAAIDVTTLITGDPQRDEHLRSADFFDVAGFTTETKINRKDFGLNWNMALEAGGFLVGDEAKVSIELEAMRRQDPAPTTSSGNSKEL